MKKNIIIVFIFSFYFSFSQTKTEKIIKEMSKKIDKIETTEYDLFSWEKKGKKIKYNEMFVKMRKNPFEVYLKSKQQNNVELLYTQKQKKIIVNPNGFPYKNIKIDPLSKKITTGMHHTIFESGFGFFNTITNSMLKDTTTKKTQIKDTIIDKKEVFKITITQKKFKLKEYKIKPKETLRDICLRKKISYYYVYNTNKKQIKNKKELTNTKIKIPPYYCEKVELYVEKERKIPVQIKIYINNKIFEKYIFKNVKINPKFNKNEISIKNKEYGF
tara:strand:- start:505 stop:1323 length:819 start_codon:yes stop_codon:yes gene_type:complete